METKKFTAQDDIKDAMSRALARIVSMKTEDSQMFLPLYASSIVNAVLEWSCRYDTAGTIARIDKIAS